jgi:hypothetical protein
MGLRTGQPRRLSLARGQPGGGSILALDDSLGVTSTLSTASLAPGHRGKERGNEAGTDSKRRQFVRISPFTPPPVEVEPENGQLRTRDGGA